MENAIVSGDGDTVIYASVVRSTLRRGDGEHISKSLVGYILMIITRRVPRVCPQAREINVPVVNLYCGFIIISLI